MSLPPHVVLPVLRTPSQKLLLITVRKRLVVVIFHTVTLKYCARKWEGDILLGSGWKKAYSTRGQKARMKDEGGRMKGMLS
jgi:hypothetical protein